MAPSPKTFDYIVVGSGAGGGPVAANLASAGFSVLLIEAGSAYKSLNIEVPGFHGQSTEDVHMRWDFWVRHYADLAQQRRDSKYYPTYTYPGATTPEVDDGVLYPRASTIGGCTAHNAMITVYPHNSDWEQIRQITGDDSWAPDNMRRYFERLERCTYLKAGLAEPAEARHGYSGWLATSKTNPSLALGDPQLLEVIATAAAQTFLDLLLREPGGVLEAVKMFFKDHRGFRNLLAALTDPKAAFVQTIVEALDPNDYRMTLERREGVYFVPLAIDAGARNGTRERILRAQEQFPENLRIWTDTLVTRIVWDGNRAAGVEYLEGQQIYRAAVGPERGRRGPGPAGQVRAAREVILAGGAFNTPQLLMLSGIGPKAELEALGINVLLGRPAVGAYLQDRYEVAVISEMTHDFSILQGCRFRLPAEGEQDDPALKQWKQDHGGLYATNGAVVAIVRRSSRAKVDPDLFIFGLPAAFKGYYPQYADALENAHNEFTWAILKAHTRNQGGVVKLSSADPLDRPKIDFHYFDEGTDHENDDLRAVVEGVKFVREFTRTLGVARRLLVRKDVQPVPDIENDDHVAEWVRNEAWGHHACGTCRIGPKGDQERAVLDSDFKVQGTDGLRVVDASVFPSIPGFFIVTPIYMIAEKASEVILHDAGRNLPDVV